MVPYPSVEGNEEEPDKGYAKAASEEYARKQKEAVNNSLFKADLVITTAMVPKCFDSCFHDLNLHVNCAE